MDESVTPPRRTLSTGRKSLFALVTCVVLFAGIELTWRALHGWNWTWLDCHRYHPVLGWSLRENWEGCWEWTAGASRINAQGLRDDRDVGTKPRGEKRLLVLGDSVTFGARVRTDETYPHQLEVALARAGLKWRVLNGGVTGYDPAQEADWLEIFGLDLQPDAIAVGFCGNDVLPSDRAEWQAQYAANRVSQWLNEHSIACYGIQRSLQRLAARLPRYVGVEHTAASFEEHVERSWPRIEEAYGRIARHARERNLPVYLFVFPSRADVRGLTKHSLRRRLRELCEREHWEMVDLFDVFRAHPDQLFLRDDELHPTPLGYQRTAEFIVKKLVGD
jgi:lysophospholipase L1-like esterase